jgi:hypothetical protein
MSQKISGYEEVLKSCQYHSTLLDIQHPYKRRIMKRYYVLIVALAFIFINGCASLTGTQISSINSYSRLLEKNAAMPVAIITEFINIKYDIELMNTGSIKPSLANEKLWNSYKGKNDAFEKAKKADASLKILEEYAVAIDRLSADELNEDLKKPSEKLGISVDTLIVRFNTATGKKIPPGIGLLLSKGTLFIGRNWIRNEQAEALREYLQEGDTLVAMITMNLKKELDSLVLGQWVPALKEDLKAKQEDLLNNLNPDGDYTAWYATQVNREAAAIIARIDNLEKLAGKASQSAGAIRRAHRELVINCAEKKTISEVLIESRNLYRATRDLYETWLTIVKPKK